MSPASPRTRSVPGRASPIDSGRVGSEPSVPHPHQDSAVGLAHGLFGSLVVLPAAELSARASSVGRLIRCGPDLDRSHLNSSGKPDETTIGLDAGRTSATVVAPGTSVRLRLWLNSDSLPQRRGISGVAVEARPSTALDGTRPTPLTRPTFVLGGGGRYRSRLHHPPGIDRRRTPVRWTAIVRSRCPARLGWRDPDGHRWRRLEPRATDLRCRRRSRCHPTTTWTRCRSSRPSPLPQRLLRHPMVDHQRQARSGRSDDHGGRRRPGQGAPGQCERHRAPHASARLPTTDSAAQRHSRER